MRDRQLASSRVSTTERSITVTGEGKITVKPDTASLNPIETGTHDLEVSVTVVYELS
jgi:uncharacterized protein YggE